MTTVTQDFDDVLSTRERHVLRYLTQPLTVLALWQPHAILCVAPDPEHGLQPAKVHETRHWAPRGAFPFAVAIHATKKFDNENRAFLTVPRFKDALKRCGYYPGDPRPFTAGRESSVPGGLKTLPLGAIVGLAVVCSCRRTDRAAEFDLGAQVATPAHDDDRAFGYWTPMPKDPRQMRFAWRLADTLLLPEPIPHTGRQEALYPVDITLQDRIHAQLRGMVAP